jgi:hypothetical protein
MSTATITAAATHYSRQHRLAVMIVAILAAAGITIAIIALTNSGSSQPAAGTRVASVAAAPLSFGGYSEPRAPFASAPALERYVEPSAPFATEAAASAPALARYVEPSAPFATEAALGYVEPTAPFAKTE